MTKRKGSDPQEMSRKERSSGNGLKGTPKQSPCSIEGDINFLGYEDPEIRKRFK